MKTKKIKYLEVEKFDNFKEMLSQAVKEAGSRTAFKYKNSDGIVEISYRDFAHRVEMLGTALSGLGVLGSHVAIVGDNSYKWITVYMTQLSSPGVFVPIDKELPFSDIIRIVNDSDSTVLFFSEKFRSDIEKNIGVFPNVKYFVSLDGTDADERFLSYDELVKKGGLLLNDGDTSFERAPKDPEELRMIVYTSGTTGTSKGVMLSEKNLVSCIYYGLMVSTIYDVCLSVLPYHHTYEAVIGILVSLYKHSTICINDSIKNTLKNLQLYKPSYIFLVPAFAESFYNRIWATAEKNGKAEDLRKLIRFSNSLRKAGIDLRRSLFKSVTAAFGGNLKELVCGGAPIRPEIGEFFDAIGIKMLNGYGITECSPLVAVNRLNDNIYSSVGYPLPCLDVKLDGVSGDGIGEICVMGPTVMLGYYKMEEKTAEVIDADGWFHTGDYGRLDDSGRIYITGRKKNIIVLNNGKNIYPEEIEEYIMTIPLVSEVVVYSEKDAYGGETSLCAEVFPNEEKINEEKVINPLERIREEIKRVCAALPSYKHILKVNLRATEFEKTTSKKIKRNNRGM